MMSGFRLTSIAKDQDIKDQRDSNRSLLKPESGALPIELCNPHPLRIASITNNFETNEYVDHSPQLTVRTQSRGRHSLSSFLFAPATYKGHRLTLREPDGHRDNT